MLRADRAGDRAGDRWTARVVSQAGIYDCVNARDPAHEPRLKPLLAGASARVQALDPTPHDASDACIVHIDGFCLR
jgi:hypothetical protein